MAKLTEEVKIYVVQALACFKKPSLIVEEVKAEFDIDIYKQQVQFYDPERGGKKKRLAKHLIEIFWETRHAFLDCKVQVGIMLQNYRLQYYQRTADYAESRRNYGLANTMYEMAAKETGGFFTNKRELSGPKGGPIPLSIEDQKKSAAERAFRKLLDKGRSSEEARAALITLGVNEDDLPPV